jgi:ABC-type dipeptide/oligopeptide/nickel transport system ATPase component
MSGAILQVEELRTHFTTDDGVVRAVDGVSFEVRTGEMLALVGESGSGKSVTALSILRLLPEPAGKVVGGRVLFQGRDLLALPAAAMRRVRGREISMVFQEPMSSLNPVFTCGEQIVEVLMLHERMARREARARAVELLEWVGIPAPDQRAAEYPHQLSGGMRQRVMIAMALACRPALLIADEPTTALDVTIQAQILELLQRLQEELGMAVLLITHDLGVVAETADRVAVLYAGQVVESCDAAAAFHHTRHPLHGGAAGVAAPARLARSASARHPRAGARRRSLPAGLPVPPALSSRRGTLPYLRPATADAGRRPRITLLARRGDRRWDPGPGHREGAGP